MKKFSLVVLAVALVMAAIIAAGCSSNETTGPDVNATATANANAIATAVAEATAQAIVYTFSSDVTGWTHETHSDSIGVSQVIHSASGGEAADGALAAVCDFDYGNTWNAKGAIMHDREIDMTGRTVRVKVNIPAGFISTGGSNGSYIQIYMQGDATTPWSGWSSSTFYPTTSGWQTFEYSPTDSWLSTVHRIGVQISIGDGTPSTYTGNIEFDSIIF